MGTGVHYYYCKLSDQDLLRDIAEWLRPLSKDFKDKRRYEGVVRYLFGLIRTDGRKTLSAMSKRLGYSDHGKLQYFISTKWASDPISAAIVERAIDAINNQFTCLVIDDIVLNKESACAVGKTIRLANDHEKWSSSRLAVSFILTYGGTATPLNLLPVCSDMGSGTIEGSSSMKYRAVLDEINRLKRAGVRFRAVLVANDYPESQMFVDGLRDIRLNWLTPVSADRPVLNFQIGHKTSKQSGSLSSLRAQAIRADELLENEGQTHEMYVSALGDRIRPEYAVARVWDPDEGRWKENVNTRGRGFLLFAARRAIKGSKQYNRCEYYMSDFPMTTSGHILSALMKARWLCEITEDQMRNIGCFDYRGQDWIGLQRHALMTCLAHAYINQRR